MITLCQHYCERTWWSATGRNRMNGHPALHSVPLFRTSSVVSSDFLPMIPAARKQPVNHQQGQNVQPSALMPAGSALSMMFKQNIDICYWALICLLQITSRRFWKILSAACTEQNLTTYSTASNSNNDIYCYIYKNLRGVKHSSIFTLRSIKHRPWHPVILKSLHLLSGFVLISQTASNIRLWFFSL